MPTAPMPCSNPGPIPEKSSWFHDLPPAIRRVAGASTLTAGLTHLYCRGRCCRARARQTGGTMALPLMPKATAGWLVENTSLTFDQIADFCGLHMLEVQASADGEDAQGIQGIDPVANGQPSHQEIARVQ